jgi:glycosyltransferase involved in cell wall biosynthesis
MKLSVVITTYNSPRWLEKVLWGYSAQSHRDFEVIVADDGSTPETGRALDAMREATGMTIKHVWHEDRGFRKSRILNRAILEVDSDYVVFTDGDCIPRADFLAVHAAEAAPGRYLSGSYLKLPMAISEAIDREAIVSGECFQLPWLRARGLRAGRKFFKLRPPPSAAPWLHLVTPTRCNFKGANGSAWLADVLAVNGFDERMPWGGLDREFGVRLRNHGVRPKHVRYNAIVLHLDHARGYKDPEKVRENRRLRQQVEKRKIRRTDFGIAQLSDT